MSKPTQKIDFATEMQTQLFRLKICFDLLYSSICIPVSAYDNPKLRELEKWGHTMTNFILEYNFDNILNGRKIENFIHEIYAIARGNDLFSMIRDFPDSEAAIKEFKECITNMQTEKRFKIVQDLLKTIKLRLGEAYFKQPLKII